MRKLIPLEPEGSIAREMPKVNGEEPFARAAREWAPMPVQPTSPTVIEDPRAGMRVSKLIGGKYTLSRRLAGTAGGDVYLASSPDHAQCVVKLVRSSVAPISEDALHEAALLGVGVVHANVVRVFEIGQIEGGCYVAMEYVDGCDLGALLKVLRESTDGMPIRQAVLIALGVARGLAATPLACDVKPSNVLIAMDGTAKLDVISMRPVHPVRIVSMDVFVLGALLYELVTGVVMSKDAPLVPPSKLRRDVPSDLESIIWKALRQTEEGYEDPAFLASDLSQLILALGQPPVKNLPR